MNKSNFFWVGLSDLMISMFFIMLVIAGVQILRNEKLSIIISENEMDVSNREMDLKRIKSESRTKDKLITELKRNNSKLTTQISLSGSDIDDLVDTINSYKNKVTVLAKEKEVLETVKKNIEKLEKENNLFIYDKKYKRYLLNFDVQFRTNKTSISPNGINDFEVTKVKLLKTGEKLREVINDLYWLKKLNKSYKNISFVIIVAGSASKTGNIDNNYIISYNRAYSLYKFWKKELDLDFDSKKYHDLIEFQISGNGIGGVGRVSAEKNKTFNTKNQRFIINIIPKIGKIDEENE